MISKVNLNETHFVYGKFRFENLKDLKGVSQASYLVRFLDVLLPVGAGIWFIIALVSFLSLRSYLLDEQTQEKLEMAAMLAQMMKE